MKFEKLGNIVTISKGKKHTLAPKRTGQNFRYIQIEDLRNNNNLKYTDEKGIEVHESDLIIAWDGANAGTIGFGLRGMIGSTLARLRIKKEKEYNTDFIGYFLKGQFNYLRANATGATIPHIDRNSLESLRIPIISYEEQYKIAEILTKAEDLIKQRKESIKLLDKFLENTFYEMFGDLNEDEVTEFEINKLKSGGNETFSNGPFGSDLLTSELKDRGIPVIYIRDIRNGFFLWKSNVYVTPDKAKSLINCQVLDNDVLIAKVGDPPGISAVYPKNSGLAIITQDVIRIRLNQKIVLPTFFSFFINSLFGRRLIKKISIEGTRNRFPLGDFKKLRIPIPVIHLQKQFTKIVERSEVLKKDFHESLYELENIFGSLNQRAFSGELEFKNIPQKEFGDPFEGMNLDNKLLSLDEVKKLAGHKLNIRTKVEDQEGNNKGKKNKKSDFSFESNVIVADIFKITEKGLYVFIRKHFKSNYFTFEDLKQSVIKEKWEYDFETLKDIVFILLRKGNLKQFFADAAFKSSFQEIDPDFDKVKKLNEQMYLQLGTSL